MGKVTAKTLKSALDKLDVKYPVKASFSVLKALFEKANESDVDGPKHADKDPERISDDARDADGNNEDRLPPAPKQDLPADEEEGDYLRKYQYKKQTPFGSKASDPSPTSKAGLMKAQLLTQPSVRIMIPRQADETKGARLSVTLNGYRLDFPKQGYVSVPEQIADVIMDSQDQQDEATLNNPLRIKEDNRELN